MRYLFRQVSARSQKIRYAAGPVHERKQGEGGIRRGSRSKSLKIVICNSKYSDMDRNLGRGEILEQVRL